MRKSSTRLREVLAINVRMERARRAWSQERLAEMAGVHRTFVGFVERAEVSASVDKIEALAKALDVDPHRLFMSPP